VFQLREHLLLAQRPLGLLLLSQRPLGLLMRWSDSRLPDFHSEMENHTWTE
jgi:hypothetical protein